MPLHFQFSTISLLWTLTFASLLVLLVVLLGRDRAKIYPLFTISMAVVTLRLLVSRILVGRLAPMALTVTLYSLAILAFLASVLVAIELARRAFTGVGRRAWLTGTLVSLAVAGIVIWLWGPWPSWQTLTAHGTVAQLRLMQLVGQRGDMLASLLAIEVGILIALFGGRFHAGLHSHTRQIVAGLSIVALSQLAVRGIWQVMAPKMSASLSSQVDYKRLLDFQEYLYNANNVVYICALIWWIVCLWHDEPGTVAAHASSGVDEVNPVSKADESDGI